MYNPLDLSKKTYLVTGASSGIGCATAILLGKLGAKIILVGRNAAKLQQVSQIIESGQFAVEEFDLADTGSIPNWINQLGKRHGVFDGLVHCAGVRFSLPLKMTDSQIIKTTFDINVHTAFFLAQAFSQKEIYRPNSSIIFISSVLGLVGKPGVSAYAASKGAIIALTKSLAVELARKKIRVNCIAPGVVKTAMIEKVSSVLTSEQQKAIESMHLLGLGEPVDVANAIAFLLSDASRWITGSTLVVDGGYTAC